MRAGERLIVRVAGHRPRQCQRVAKRFDNRERDDDNDIGDADTNRRLCRRTVSIQPETLAFARLPRPFVRNVHGIRGNPECSRRSWLPRRRTRLSILPRRPFQIKFYLFIGWFPRAESIGWNTHASSANLVHDARLVKFTDQALDRTATLLDRL